MYGKIKYESVSGTDAYMNGSVLCSALMNAHFRLMDEGRAPIDIRMRKKYVMVLYYFLIHDPDPKFDPQDGTQVGEFMGVPLFVDEGQEIFSYIGVK